VGKNSLIVKFEERVQNKGKNFTLKIKNFNKKTQKSKPIFSSAEFERPKKKNYVISKTPNKPSERRL